MGEGTWMMIPASLFALCKKVKINRRSDHWIESWFILYFSLFFRLFHSLLKGSRKERRCCHWSAPVGWSQQKTSSHDARLTRIFSPCSISYSASCSIACGSFVCGSCRWSYVQSRDLRFKLNYIINMKRLLAVLAALNQMREEGRKEH